MSTGPSGLCAVSANPVSSDLLAHLTPVSGTTATAVTITGPLKLALIAATGTTNTSIATEVSDGNYTTGGPGRQPVNGWTTIAPPTSGSGSANGFSSRSNTGALTFFSTTGVVNAGGVTISSVVLYSSDATPVPVFYQNFSTPVGVSVNNTYTIAVGSLVVQLG